MKTKEITTIFDETVTVSNKTICVTMSDNILGGWACNDYKPHKRVYICENMSQAMRLVNRLTHPKHMMSYVRVRVGIPYYSPSRYTVSYDKYSDNIYTY